MVALSDADRLREEDPFTGQAIVDVPTHIIAHRSRFEARSHTRAGNRGLSNAGAILGLEVWREPPLDAVVEGSLGISSPLLRRRREPVRDIAADLPALRLLDVPATNHAAPAPTARRSRPTKRRKFNIGTFSMPREEWAWLLDPLLQAMREYDFGGRRLDVRENVAFQGKGELTRFVHER